MSLRRAGTLTVKEIFSVKLIFLHFSANNLSGMHVAAGYKLIYNFKLNES